MTYYNLLFSLLHKFTKMSTQVR